MARRYKQDARAFCSLLCRDGALAKYFFNICYFSTNDSFDPFVACSVVIAVFMEVILYLAVGLLTSFASELLSFTKYSHDVHLRA